LRTVGGKRSRRIAIADVAECRRAAFLARLCTSFLSVASSGSIAPVRDELWQRIAIVFWIR
jgi:hypothetical protein